MGKRDQETGKGEEEDWKGSCSTGVPKGSREMIKINYRRYTEKDLDKVREILGVGRDYTGDIDEISRLSSDHSKEVANLLGVDEHHAYLLIGGLLNKKTAAGGFVPPSMADDDEPTINLHILGDDTSEETAEKDSALFAHELGHAKDALAPSRGEEAYQTNPMIGELVAIYYSYLTNQNKALFDDHMGVMERRYQRFVETRPEVLKGFTFAEMKAVAMKIAKQDLGAATPEQRALRRQGKKRRNGGSGAEPAVKEIR